MTTRLSDAFIPSVYLSYGANNSPERSGLITSAAATTSPVLNTIARTGGSLSYLPFWNDLNPNDEPNYSNDDPADEATPGKIGSGSMLCRKAFVNKGYADMDLVQELASSSPMARIRDRFGAYWRGVFERRVIASLRGVLADNIANDGGDMVINISGLAGDAAKFNSDAFIDAAFTSGDYADSYRAIAVHSAIMARMLKNDEIVYLPDSDGKLTIPTYKGRTVITSDNMPIMGGAGADTQYLTILFGAGSIGFGAAEGTAVPLGEGVPRVPSEVVRSARAGNGGGMEEIWERKTWIIHPRGFSWNELSGADEIVEFSPSLAELREAKRWNRVVDRKNVGLAFLISKG